MKAIPLKIARLVMPAVLALLVGGLAGCGSSGDAGAKPTTPGRLDSNQQRILEIEQRGGVQGAGGRAGSQTGAGTATGSQPGGGGPTRGGEGGK